MELKHPEREGAADAPVIVGAQRFRVTAFALIIDRTASNQTSRAALAGRLRARRRAILSCKQRPGQSGQSARTRVNVTAHIERAAILNQKLTRR